MEALGDGGGVAEDAAAEPASDARRDARAAHLRLVVGVHALSAARRELLGMHGGGAGAQACRHRRRRRGLRGVFSFLSCPTVLRLKWICSGLAPERVGYSRANLVTFLKILFLL